MTGMHQTKLRDVAMNRVTSAYTLWMLQRPLAAYAPLNAKDRVRVDEALAGTGCEQLLGYRPRHRLGKKQFKLIFLP